MVVQAGGKNRAGEAWREPVHGQGEDRGVSQPPGSTGRIFLLTAMTEEAAALGEDLGCLTWMQEAGARFAVGSGPYSAVAVGISGIGKVAAAIAAQYACDRWRPWLLMVSGIAGGVQPDARVGDLVVPSDTLGSLSAGSRPHGLLVLAP
jgi:hypothetical protein